MSEHPSLDTIIAPATPLGRSALAIVRIDGPQAHAIFAHLSAEVTRPRVATLARVSDAAGVIDECIAIRYEAPQSFTGNDLVELTLHGNPMLVDRLITAALHQGARIAEPGEFTERAVLNGKMDLVQAEAIADLISSRTRLQSKVSLENLDGRLSRVANEMRHRLLTLISRLEAALDFSDEGYEFTNRDEVRGWVAESIAKCEQLAETYERGRATASGITAVILGRPNAGKSTLLNRLVGSERAIVTATPGTTRDTLRETIEMGGLPVTLIDTAGLRVSQDEVEGIGIERARKAAVAADIVIYAIDSVAGLTDEDELELRGVAAAEVVRVWTKVDLAPSPPGELGISVAKETGVEALVAAIDVLVRHRFAVPESSPVLVNARQRAAVATALESLVEAARSVESGADEPIILVDLYRAATALGELVGAVTRDEILEEIFARFCIGK